ncbi:peptide deformylase [Rickettsia prowazekii]|uniref:Peptide deformylase n=2 Tax=Rickettsia prowazekii TaxID=782 RepID=DEF_RICPR|nr:peptide deformylase [Rickettsia prowazekii]Q9ZDV8.1 RecName: Full=Peptide deformylase; Short=PDF; AltName: Full=Polypeptide deformylase [Rickettsia prowazekii str. Madrid E]EOB10731.1 Peptide deformylase [Rickettsia prowazekii str. GvF12]ADE29720.1 Polypeptide deformylase [Rickettsia prowazekii str. Rp22]AFE49030.1 peptide deformylase [Rickettsia prowazekii str. Chernikova]AFE49876.1 peptide deformylase [Rickettsia prowazekii str. Katsinyian]AFE50720.1 peptide deformylase [Rickettsia prowa
MSIFSIVTAPDERLKQKSKPVLECTDQTRKFMHDMLETMYNADGAGLAAVQVGILLRILVIDIKEYDPVERPKDFYPLFIVNPEIIEKSTELVTANEGCISLPKQRIEVTRPESVKIRYLDYHGKSQELKANDWLARVIQHEYDHLEGKLMVDYLSNLKRDVVLRKLKKLKNNIV